MSFNKPIHLCFWARFGVFGVSRVEDQFFGHVFSCDFFVMSLVSVCEHVFAVHNLIILCIKICVVRLVIVVWGDSQKLRKSGSMKQKKL